MSAEEWRDIPEYVGRYQASDRGRIRSVPRKVVAGHPNRVRGITPHILKTHYTLGYEAVTIRTNGKRKTERVHSLVASAFLGERPPGHVVNHINLIKTDNRADNLEYITHRENVLHAHLYGRGRARFSPERAEAIRADRADGMDYKALREKYGGSYGSLRAVVDKKGVYGEYDKARGI